MHDESCTNDSEITYAKNELGVMSHDSKILGLHWNKKKDTLGINFTKCKQVEESTKREVLKAMASVYDPLGIVSPFLLVAKNIYREICDSRHSWDAPLQELLKIKWIAWIKSLPSLQKFPRCIPKTRAIISGVELHGFGDASKNGCCSAIYAVIYQRNEVSKGLLKANSRISKRDTSIPRLELIGGHMVTNSLSNVRNALHNYPIISTYAWLDSTVVLHWIQNDNKEWKQFVSNRVIKINEKQNIEWRYCPSRDNPADIGSRGTNSLSSLWFEGPKWLTDKGSWPKNIAEGASKEIETERKLKKKIILLTTEPETNTLLKLLEKCSTFNKLISITAWIQRFTANTRQNQKEKGEISTDNVANAKSFWITRTQSDGTKTEKHQIIARRVKLEPNNDGILVCKGRITGEHPIYLPSPHQFTTLAIVDAHLETHHGLVGLTMAKVREKYWVERLRSQVKSVIHECTKCKIYNAKPCTDTPITTLPTFRTTVSRAFEKVGVDFAGPLLYKDGKTDCGRAYITLFSCATSRSAFRSVR